MKVDDFPASGGLVQPVDILSEKKLALAVGFQPRQGVMRVVGLRRSEPPPTDHASRPVAPARCFIGNESLEPDRLRSLPVAIAVAIVRDTGVGAAAGTRENEQPLVLFDEGLEGGICHD